MIPDTLTSVASVVSGNGIMAAIGVGSALGVTGIVGKLIWKGMNPHCNVPNHAEQHQQMSENIIETKTHVEWIRKYLEEKVR